MKDKKIADALQRIYERNGEVKASVVVQSARPRNSALHQCFQWNDKKAGDEYRLIQARRIIRSYEIVVDGVRQKLVHVPVIKERADTKEGSYKPIHVVSKDELDFELALNEALADLRAAKARVNELTETVSDEDKTILAKLVLSEQAISMATEALRSIH